MTDEMPASDERRNFIFVATGAVAFGGVAMAAWPLIDQMNPARDTRASSSLDVDISKIRVGSELRVLIGGKPFFVRHRTEVEIAEARAVNIARLRDPETDEERLRPNQDGALNSAILITSGVCTHLGCVPLGPNQGNVGDYGGWYCPCHGSQYDTSGRIRKGPAPLNLPVPDYIYQNGNIVTISI
jgi:ubiquinol-cytochrome c reductase iron-sulfur subunit